MLKSKVYIIILYKEVENIIVHHDAMPEILHLEVIYFIDLLTFSHTS